MIGLSFGGGFPAAALCGLNDGGGDGAGPNSCCGGRRIRPSSSILGMWLMGRNVMGGWPGDWVKLTGIGRISGLLTFGGSAGIGLGDVARLGPGDPTCSGPGEPSRSDCDRIYLGRGEYSSGELPLPAC